MKHESTTCDSGHRRSPNRSHNRSHRHRGRKERVLHTRISEQLAEDIRQFADDLRVPASNLVRNVLEEVFTMVDSVSDDVGDLFDDVLSEAEAVRDRVRGQAASGRRNGVGRAWRRRSRRRPDGDVDLEAEFMQDEESESSEAADEPSGPRPAGSSQSASGERAEQSAADPRRAAELFPEILGWQPLVLNRELACGCCNRRLAAGESAFLGLGEQGLTGTALCGRCAGRR